MHLKNFFVAHKLLLLNIVFVLYIATNLIGGERGLISFFEKKNIEKKLIVKEKRLSKDLLNLEKKNQLLSDKIDLDYLDMLYREKLKLGKKDEILIKLN